MIDWLIRAALVAAVVYVLYLWYRPKPDPPSYTVDDQARRDVRNLDYDVQDLRSTVEELRSRILDLEARSQSDPPSDA